MVMERETLPRLEGELEARRAELSALMRRCRTREAQDQAILRKDELKGVEKEIAEVRTSVQATRRQAVTLAQKTISKVAARRYLSSPSAAFQSP